MLESLLGPDDDSDGDYRRILEETRDKVGDLQLRWSE